MRAQIAVAHVLFRFWPVRAIEEILHSASLSPRTALAVGSFLFKQLASDDQTQAWRGGPRNGSFATAAPTAGEPLVLAHPLDAGSLPCHREVDFFAAGSAATVPTFNPRLAVGAGTAVTG